MAYSKKQKKASRYHMMHRNIPDYGGGHKNVRRDKLITYGEKSTFKSTPFILMALMALRRHSRKGATT